MQTIALIDYGSGNLRSAERALLAAAGAANRRREVRITADPDFIRRADRLVLPGVGAFGACISALRAREGVVEAMREAVLAKGRPFLGICVGAQLLADRGLELGEHQGLSWIGGVAQRLAPNDPHLPIPHMGWNATALAAPHACFAGLGAEPFFYFANSFAVSGCARADVLAEADYGGRFVAALARGPILGVQFHPEKSQRAGLRLLANFVDWRP